MTRAIICFCIICHFFRTSLRILQRFLQCPQCRISCKIFHSANARSAAIAKEKLAEEILKLKFELQSGQFRLPLTVYTTFFLDIFYFLINFFV